MSVKSDNNNDTTTTATATDTHHQNNSSSSSRAVSSNNNNNAFATSVDPHVAVLGLSSVALQAYFATKHLLQQGSSYNNHNNNNNNNNSNNLGDDVDKKLAHQHVLLLQQVIVSTTTIHNNDHNINTLQNHYTSINSNEQLHLQSQLSLDEQQLLSPPSIVSLAPLHEIVRVSSAAATAAASAVIPPVSTNNLLNTPAYNNANININARDTTTPTNFTSAAVYYNNNPNNNNSSSSASSNSPLAVLGHHALFKALERLDGYEAKELALHEVSDLVTHLTQLVMQDNSTATTTTNSAPDFQSPRHALAALAATARVVPRRVCQHPFRKNDIVWVCRTCQADETCVLCHACFSASTHDGHDVAFYHAQAGGCCDCGDPDAWDPAGFCPNHGPGNADSGGSSDNGLPSLWVARIQGMVPAAVDWIVETIAKQAQDSHARARPPPEYYAVHSSIISSNIADTASSVNDNNNVNFTNANGSAMSTIIDEIDDIVNDNDNENANIGSTPATDAIENIDSDDDDDMDTMPADMIPPPPPLHMFSPSHASRIRSERLLNPRNDNNTDDKDTKSSSSGTAATNARNLTYSQNVALQLGQLGASQGGLYIVLQADDIHASHQWSDAIRDFYGPTTNFTETLLNKLVKTLRQYGQLVVWGNVEVVMELGMTQTQLWLDGDNTACRNVGALFLERTRRLAQHSIYCGILTRQELWQQPRAVVTLQWLSAVARSCDPLCQTVAESLQPQRHLVPLLEADFKMSARVTKSWYSLLLTLLAVPTFKSHLAAAYCDTYRNVTAKYARGMGVLERSGYTLSVQFLNRVTYVVDLVQSRDLLGKLGQSLLETFLVARPPRSQRLDPNHFVLTHRRYSPCLSDLKCVLNVAGMPRLFASLSGTFLNDWLQVLSISQCMDPQEWRHWTQGHVEDESRGWVGAFNASISLGSLFERLLGWEDDEKSPLTDLLSPLSRHLMSCVELTLYILQNGVHTWQQSERKSYRATPYSSMLEDYRYAPAALPMSTVAARHGTAVAMDHLPIAQATSFSFHLPLHRFAAGCLRELCLRENDTDAGMTKLLHLLVARMPPPDLNALWCGLMEFPVTVLCRAAQVRAGLWRRNGSGLNDQVLNYAEPPFCRTMRDADLLMLQFATIGRTMYQRGSNTLLRPSTDVGMSFLVHLLLHRLDIFEFVGMMKAPNLNMSRYQQEVAKDYYNVEPRADDVPEEEVLLPWTYSLAREVAASLVLVEEFLHLIIMFASELPHVVPMSKDDLVEQARCRIHREVVHRLASGPKTHSELSEVHHVLSHRDNVLLGEEGKKLNPDDASGAVLGTVLAEIAERKSSRTKLEPDKWELVADAWKSYDPSFYHICSRSHQTAAEGRPKPVVDETGVFGWKPKAYAPSPAACHFFFERLRRDAICDSTVLAVVYRVLHLHCREDNGKGTSDAPGRFAYESKERSETSLARVVHLLTLGVYAWKGADADDNHWREKGGGSAGSVFFDRSDSSYAPVARDWIIRALLVDPLELMCCEWYRGEENMLLLLRRLATTGGVAGGFVAQDATVRAGAAWMCEFACKNCTEAKQLLRPLNNAPMDNSSEHATNKSEAEERRRKAKEAALARMKAQAAKFATAMELDIDDDTDSGIQPTLPYMEMPARATRNSSFASTMSLASTASGTFTPPNEAEVDCVIDSLIGINTPVAEPGLAPPRLLKVRPRCIICNDEDGSDNRALTDSTEGMSSENVRKRSRRRAENALGFVGYAQASTALKGGGGPPSDTNSSMTSVREFVGVHVALCGHAVHSECCESYLATVLHREDRAIGKREEFKCPLCQRLSNCLVPFIDVGADWIKSSDVYTSKAGQIGKSESDDVDGMEVDTVPTGLSLNESLSESPWWGTRFCKDVTWDGQSAFVDTLHMHSSEMPHNDEDHHSLDGKKSRRRGVRSLKKKDLYAAWTAMMKTPRIVRRRLRSRGQDTQQSETTTPGDTSKSVAVALESTAIESDDTAGETIVWRRFMDQLSDLSYRADSKRLGDEHLHDMCGEFRHYIVERYAYNVATRIAGGEAMDWPACIYSHAVNDNVKQILSREKLLSKLLLSIQSFTYSCCCEIFEAKRALRKCHVSGQAVAVEKQGSIVESIHSKFGISGVVCGGQLVVMAKPANDEDDGFQPFNGRLGKLRYLALAIMAAAGAVSADLVQLVMEFPVKSQLCALPGMSAIPDRAPVAYPLLFGNVLTHVVAAMCAACGRARAQSDSLDMSWTVSFSSGGSFAIPDRLTRRKSTVEEDCESFIKLGLLARILQVLLGAMKVPDVGVNDANTVSKALLDLLSNHEGESASTGIGWTRACVKLICSAISEPKVVQLHRKSEFAVGLHSDKLCVEKFDEACALAAEEAATYLSDVAGIMQVLLPGAFARYAKVAAMSKQGDDWSQEASVDKLCELLHIETLDEMLQSRHVQEVVSFWYARASEHAKAGTLGGYCLHSALKSRLNRTRGYRCYDWPMAGSFDSNKIKTALTKVADKAGREPVLPMHIESLGSGSASVSSMTEALTEPVMPRLVTFISKTTVPLLGGFMFDALALKADSRPRVAVIPTSYTDLYAELGTLLPDCEQTAVCLICGEVLNAAGKGECTKHSYKCGAGAGMFFLLQECSGLIMHKSKAAYIHSPYVDSHGETPQYRGRPLNLDLNRYEHFREVWYGHAVRQQVVAERGSSRQIILPDFY